MSGGGRFDSVITCTAVFPGYCASAAFVAIRATAKTKATAKLLLNRKEILIVFVNVRIGL